MAMLEGDGDQPVCGYESGVSRRVCRHATQRPLRFSSLALAVVNRRLDLAPRSMGRGDELVAPEGCDISDRGVDYLGRDMREVCLEVLGLGKGVLYIIEGGENLGDTGDTIALALCCGGRNFKVHLGLRPEVAVPVQNDSSIRPHVGDHAGEQAGGGQVPAPVIGDHGEVLRRPVGT